MWTYDMLKDQNLNVIDGIIPLNLSYLSVYDYLSDISKLASIRYIYIFNSLNKDVEFWYRNLIYDIDHNIIDLFIMITIIFHTHSWALIDIFARKFFSSGNIKYFNPPSPIYWEIVFLDTQNWGFVYR